MSIDVKTIMASFLSAATALGFAAYFDTDQVATKATAVIDEMQETVQELTGEEVPCTLKTITIVGDEVDSRIGTLMCQNETWYFRQGVEVLENISGERVWNFTGPLLLLRSEEGYNRKHIVNP